MMWYTLPHAYWISLGPSCLHGVYGGGGLKWVHMVIATLPTPFFHPLYTVYIVGDYELYIIVAVQPATQGAAVYIASTV